MNEIQEGTTKQKCRVAKAIEILKPVMFELKEKQLIIGETTESRHSKKLIWKKE